MDKGSVYSTMINAKRLGSINAAAFVRNASLYSRIGEDAALSKITHDFYAKAATDARLRKFFDIPNAAEMEKQIQKQLTFLKVALGGANTEGLDMRMTYTYLSSLGLTDAHFDAVVEIVSAILQEQKVTPALIDEMTAFCESVRKYVLG